MQPHVHTLFKIYEHFFPFLAHCVVYIVPHLYKTQFQHENATAQIFSIHITMGVFLIGMVRCADYDSCDDLSTKILGQKAVS